MDRFEESTSSLNWAEMSTEEKKEYLKSHQPDCSFLVGQTAHDIATVKSYKTILSSVSPVFERMFQGYFKEAAEPEAIPIIDVCASDFKKFLTYIISGTNGPLKLSVDSMINQAALGKKYMVPSTVEKFTTLIKEHASTVEGFDLIKCLAHGIENDDDNLVTLCSSRLINSNIIKYQENKMPPFIYDLNIKTFHVLLSLLKAVSTTPVQMFNHVETYAKVQRLQRNKSLADELSCEADENDPNLDLLFKLVDFENMSPHEFCIGPGNSNLLDAEEKFSILKGLCLNYSERKYGSSWT